MTTNELIKHFNTEFTKNGIESKWPETYEVDAETYGHVCNFMLLNKFESSGILVRIINDGYIRYYTKDLSLIVGKSGGVVLKNVELILK